MSQHLVVKQSSVADIWPPEEATTWQRSHSHKPVARLTMVLTWPQPLNASSRHGLGGEAPIFFSIAAAMGLLLAVVIVVLGTIALAGALVEKISALTTSNMACRLTRSSIPTSVRDFALISGKRCPFSILGWM